MSTRIYLVTDVETNKHRLIRASNQAQAIKYAAQTRFDIEVAGQDDLVSLLTGGTAIEMAGAGATIDMFEETIANECRKLSDCVARCLRAAGVKAAQVDTVFFTGGSTFIPAIERACLVHTPQAKIVRGDKFASVGVGLTIDSGLKFG